VSEVQTALLCVSAKHDVVLNHHEAAGVEIEETTDEEHVDAQHPAKSSDEDHSHNKLNQRQNGKEGENDNLEDDVDVNKARFELADSVNHQRNQCNITPRNDDRNGEKTNGEFIISVECREFIDNEEDWSDNSSSSNGQKLQTSHDVASNLDQVPHSHHVVAVDCFPEFEGVDENPNIQEEHSSTNSV